MDLRPENRLPTLGTIAVQGLIALVAGSVVNLATPARAEGPKSGLAIKTQGFQFRYMQDPARKRHRMNLHVDTSPIEDPARRVSVVSPKAAALVTQSQTPNGTITNVALSLRKRPGKLNRRWFTRRVARRPDETAPFRTHAANLYDEHREGGTSILSRSAPGELIVTDQRIVWTPTLIGRLQGRKVQSLEWSDVKKRGGITVERSTRRDHSLITVSPRSAAGFEKIWRIPDTLVGKLKAALPAGFALKEISPLPAR